MANTICTLEKIELTMVPHPGKMYLGAVDADGVELHADWKDTPETKLRRQYRCSNCGVLFDGQDSFVAVKAHLGNVVETKVSPHFRLDKDGQV